jgi:hypothetical protein
VRDSSKTLLKEREKEKERNKKEKERNKKEKNIAMLC